MKPLSREFLLKRGFCCNNGCKNCPYNTMIRYESKGGVQKITAICNNCKCEIKDLTIEDITVKTPSDMIIKDKDGKEITRTEHEYNDCKCTDCHE